MYNRAPRDISLNFKETIPGVDPTTYSIDSPDTRVNVVPFSSTEDRFSKSYRKPICEIFYDLPGFNPFAKGGSTPRNKAPRFIYNYSDTPSPVDYDPKIQGKCQRDVPCGVRPKKLYVCRTPYSLKGSAPSIPIDSYGYTLTKNESLIKIIPKQTDTSLGPAYYHVPCSSFSESNKGCNWSGRTGKRSCYKIDENPSPTAYDVEVPKCWKRAEEEEVREMARRFSFVPRYLETQEFHLLREDLPGPAHYCVNSCDVCKMCPSVKPRPFICGSKRFTPTVSEDPGPGRYDIVDIKYPVSKKDVPFSIESSRFAKKNIDKSPGPASYDIRSPLTEKLLKKKNLYSMWEVPFNNTAKRGGSIVQPDAASTPSPADYDRKVQGHCKILVSSVFKSKTQRFKPICKKNEISPATYNITDAFNKMTEKISHQVFEVSFNAKADRKEMIKKDETPELVLIGPADYCTQMGLSSKGHLFPVSARFDEPPLSAPSPCTYYIHPSYANSLYGATKTFNLGIKESVLKKRLRRSPTETWSKWAMGLKKKKKLKWFFYNG